MFASGIPTPAVARALEDPRSLGSKVVISEETGTYLPLGLAELLAEIGVDVVIVSPNLFIGETALKRFELPLKLVNPRLSCRDRVDYLLHSRIVRET